MLNAERNAVPGCIRFGDDSFGFIEQVLSEDRACQDVVCRYLAERTADGASASGLNTGAYCQARKRLPLEVPEQLYGEIGQALEEKMPKAWRWHGRWVKLFDGTTVSMPDTAENQKDFPQNPSRSRDWGFLWRVSAG